MHGQNVQRPHPVGYIIPEYLMTKTWKNVSYFTQRDYPAYANGHMLRYGQYGRPCGCPHAQQRCFQEGTEEKLENTFLTSIIFPHPHFVHQCV